MNIEIKQQINFENHAKYNQTKYNQLKNANPNNLSFITTYKDFVKLDESFKNKYTVYVCFQYCFSKIWRAHEMGPDGSILSIR